MRPEQFELVLARGGLARRWEVLNGVPIDSKTTRIAVEQPTVCAPYKRFPKRAAVFSRNPAPAYTWDAGFGTPSAIQRDIAADTYDSAFPACFCTVHQSANRDGDGGVDLYAVDGDNKSWIVQCKCWAQHRTVGPEVARELYRR
ncbi:restriction endonuclease [Achromobacter xylosoxidans]|uniref:restriction endonuclease n=1 Tax=Alcaligenes xylosoxydans xylosoxydans TaxID=85698 RepID=UPI00211B4D76|nr:restriction endonuclease [Achromobacter xylosoxidans]